MKIVMVSGIFPPDIGGPARYVPTMAAKLVERGHQVSVVTLTDHPNTDDSAFPFPVIRIRRDLPRLVRLWRAIRAIWKQARASEVVLANTLGFEAALAGALARRPVVHKVVGDYAWERARNQGAFLGTIDEYQTAPKGLRLRSLDAWRDWPLRQAARVITPSDYLKRMVTGWGMASASVEVIYNAFEDGSPAAARPAATGEARLTFTTVCRLVPWKGVGGIIEAVAALPDCHLQIVGDGPLQEKLTAQARDLAVADRVHFLGRMDRESVLDVLRRSDGFILNSTYEGLPHVVLEAMACGVPVVASGVGGTPEIVRDGRTGLLVPPGDTSALVAALRRLTQDEELRDRLAVQARDMVAETFSMKTMVARTEACLEAVVVGH